MARVRHILLYARFVTGLLAFVTLLLVGLALAVFQFLPRDWVWLPTRTVQAFVALNLIYVGLSVGSVVLRAVQSQRS